MKDYIIQLTKTQKETLRELRARALEQWICGEENTEPSTIPYSLDYDTLMEGVSV